jgi:NADH:ubiquinone oxidoreductase subunit 6 (subunit J)
MDKKKLFKNSIILSVIGMIAMLIASIIMMSDWKRESAGEHVILGVILGLGFGLLVSVIILQWSEKSRFKLKFKSKNINKTEDK